MGIRDNFKLRSTAIERLRMRTTRSLSSWVTDSSIGRDTPLCIGFFIIRHLYVGDDWPGAGPEGHDRPGPGSGVYVLTWSWD